MSSDGLPLVGFDIETDTSTGGLDPESARIVAIALATDHGDHVLTGGETEILRAVDDLVASLPPGLLVTWNGAGFDLPFVQRRAELAHLGLGLSLVDEPRRRSHREPGRPAVRARWHHLVHLDGYLVYRADVGRSLGLSCGLKPLARLVGLAPVELDRATLHTAPPEELAAYVASDARMAVELVRRRMPSAAAAADHRVNIGCHPGDGSPTTASIGPVTVTGARH